MNIYQAQKISEREHEGRGEFLAFFPAGMTKCTWLDAYMGLFRIGDMEGFAMVSAIDDMFPNLECRPIVQPATDQEEE